MKPDQQRSTNLTATSEIPTPTELPFTEFGFSAGYTL